MSANTFGTLFRLTTFGESHGVAVGGIIDGCPAGLAIDIDFVQNELNRRRPGQSDLVSSRNEPDILEWLSGIFEGKTTGAPIAFLARNQDKKSDDYSEIQKAYRPSHADYVYDQKYGFRDYRGGGRSSARETLSRVAGGAVAKLLLKQLDINVLAYVSAIGTESVLKKYTAAELGKASWGVLNCPEKQAEERMIKLMEKLRSEGDTTGGVITCVISGVPAGLGEPVFDKLHADLAKAMLSINAVKGFEYGEGFAASAMRGSEHNDVFVPAPSGIAMATNHSGGIQGGISNGSDIVFRVAFKPVATIMQQQQTVNSKGETVQLPPKGRHDVCVVPRAVPIVEAMAALVLADHWLRNKTTRL